MAALPVKADGIPVAVGDSTPPAADALVLLQSAAVAIHDALDQYAGQTVPLAYGWTALGKVRNDVNDVNDKATGLLYDAMGTKRITVEGLGVLERSHASRWGGWDVTGVFAELRERVVRRFVDPATGEVPPFVREVAAACFAEVHSVCSVEPRITRLRDRDLAPDEFGEQVWGKRTVRLYGVTKP